MLIREWMSKPAITIDRNGSLDDAAELFFSRVISMLPVMDKDRVVGVLTDGDLKRALPSNATTLDRYELADLMGQAKVHTIMSSPAITVPIDRTIDEAARLMLSSGISGLPVTEDGSLTGVITKSDVFRCLVSFTGVAVNGQVFGFRLQDRPGSIKEVTEILREFGGRLSSIMTSYDDTDPGYRTAYFHTSGIEKDMFAQLVVRLKGAGTLAYAADLSRGITQTYLV